VAEVGAVAHVVRATDRQRRVVVVSARVVEAMEPDVAHSGRIAPRVLQVRIDGVDYVDVDMVARRLFGAKVEPSVARAEILQEQPVGQVVLQVAPVDASLAVPVAVVEHAVLADLVAAFEVGFQGPVEPGVVAGVLLGIGGRELAGGLGLAHVGRLADGQERVLGSLEELRELVGVGLAGEVIHPELVGLGHADLEGVQTVAEGVVELVFLFERLAVVEALGQFRAKLQPDIAVARVAVDRLGPVLPELAQADGQSAPIGADGGPPASVPARRFPIE